MLWMEALIHHTQSFLHFHIALLYKSYLKADYFAATLLQKMVNLKGSDQFVEDGSLK